MMDAAEKVLLIDAHLEFDGMVEDFLDVFKPHEMKVFRYDYNPMKRKLIHYSLELNMNKRKFSVTFA